MVPWKKFGDSRLLTSTPPKNTNSSPLKNAGWKMSFLSFWVNFGLFSGALAVSFGEGIIFKFQPINSRAEKKNMFFFIL